MDTTTGICERWMQLTCELLYYGSRYVCFYSGGNSLYEASLNLRWTGSDWPSCRYKGMSRVATGVFIVSQCIPQIYIFLPRRIAFLLAISGSLNR